ncbi:hypothetical protein ElyMa_002267800 [Elysia marginata]|uniref:Uncharacterized protein n=1 Tax=Elysia marginata TaxID=1093978 RepID=A0AAV4G0V9_9GAST|nr:hypothetical protein ElyMa_002267800 [Elysia marginata]
MDVLYMFAIPIKWGEDVLLERDLLDLRLAVDPSSGVFKALVDLMNRRECCTLWLTKPKTRPTYVDSREFLENDKLFHECVPDEFRDEVEQLSGKFSDVVVFKPGGYAYVKSLKHHPETVLYSFFVQSVQHLNKMSRILYALAGKRAPLGVGLFQSSELKQCCIDHLVFHLQKGVGGLELRVYIGGHSDHLALPFLKTLRRWFEISPQDASCRVRQSIGK